MKSILDEVTKNEIVSRVNLLTENSQAKWGKMSVAQMIKHCAQWDEMALGKKKYKQSFIGKLFGKIALKDMLKDEPVKKNLPTVPSFKINEVVNFAEEKSKWIKLLDEYKNLSDSGFMHPFFGKITKENTGYLAYKHMDHHLRQFNV
ncbi:MAG TPA: DUF1569 domain-containing protein [Bacteroidia bacterium]|nr:DUF1569 domain-containing protein [Bacteroidia bacterium]